MNQKININKINGYLREGSKEEEKVDATHKVAVGIDNDPIAFENNAQDDSAAIRGRDNNRQGREHRRRGGGWSKSLIFPIKLTSNEIVSLTKC